MELDIRNAKTYCQTNTQTYKATYSRNLILLSENFSYNRSELEKNRREVQR